MRMGLSFARTLKKLAFAVCPLPDSLIFFIDNISQDISLFLLNAHASSCVIQINVCLFVCLFVYSRWTLLQDVLNSWQEYRDEERRLSGWLHLKESQVEDLKHIDIGDLNDLRINLAQVTVSCCI